MLNLLNLLHPFWIRSAGSSPSSIFSGCCVTHQSYPSLCFFPGRHSEFAQHPRGCAGCGVSSEGPGLEPAHQQCRHQLPCHTALPGLAGDAQRVCHQRGWATPGCQGMSGPFGFLLLGKMFPDGNKVTSVDLPCLPRGAQHFSPAQHPSCLVLPHLQSLPAPGSLCWLTPFLRRGKAGPWPLLGASPIPCTSARSVFPPTCPQFVTEPSRMAAC